MLLTLYVTSLLIFLVADLIWMRILVKKFYAQQLESLTRDPVNYVVAFFIYLILILGLTVFVTVPAVEKNSLNDAMWRGGLFGFVVYSVYDLTNVALLKKWPIPFSVVDILWGTVISGFVSAVTFILAGQLW